MVHLRKRIGLVALTASVMVIASAMVACSHPTVYQPEVDGPGAKISKGDLVYSIPPKKTLLKMKLASAVQPKGKSLRIRMFFVRKGEPAGEYLDPQEQTISLPDSTALIAPSRVHASIAGKPMIKLTGDARQAVELHYTVPTSGDEFPYIKLNWVIHYVRNGVAKTESQTVRFDYVDKPDASRGVGLYRGSDEFPDAGVPTLPKFWTPATYAWW